MSLVDVETTYGAWHVRAQVDPGDSHGPIVESIRVRQIGWPSGFDDEGWLDRFDLGISYQEHLAIHDAVVKEAVKMWKRRPV